ncbi:MAG: RIP metalloprotease RseP [Burkholderiaceae bacterium]|nr:RIP metalloprotease RseP [Burkholderiaceae bacterium]
MTTLLAFVVALGVLIVFHELGHYLVARWAGVKILKFSFGFGPKLFSKKMGRDQTEWIISAFPLGGYVSMLDEREEDQTILESERHRAFNRQSVFKRIAIVAAGPLANLLLAVFLYAVIGMMGQPMLKTVFWDPQPASQAQTVGIQRYDTAVSLAGARIGDVESFNWRLMEKAGERDVPMVVSRDGVERTVYWDLSAIEVENEKLSLPEQLGLTYHYGTTVIAEVQAGKPAQLAGLRAGDRVLKADGKEILISWQLLEKIRANKGEALILTVQGEKEDPREVAVYPTMGEITNEKGETMASPVIGAMIRFDPNLYWQQLGPIDSVVKGFERIVSITKSTAKAVTRMVTGDASTKGISGPVTIADYAGKSAEMGIRAYLAFLAMISVSLGILNLLPIPMLDGGHLLYYLVEIVCGRPLPDEWMAIGQKIGLFIVLALGALALTNDFVRLLQ